MEQTKEKKLVLIRGNTKLELYDYGSTVVLWLTDFTKNSLISIHITKLDQVEALRRFFIGE